jgi:hypothetical protein
VVKVPQRAPLSLESSEICCTVSAQSLGQAKVFSHINDRRNESGVEAHLEICFGQRSKLRKRCSIGSSNKIAENRD